MTMAGMSAGQRLVNTASGGKLGSYPSFGMSMRFQVTVGPVGETPANPSSGLNLGLWQSCKGLQVELKYKTVLAGGEYQQVYPLPDRITWSPVTLERAVEQSASLAVWDWLDQCMGAWKTTPPTAGGLPAASEMTITLLDYQLNSILQWTLSGVRPIKWVGPQLSATDNKVAIEQLMLEHQGFECTKPKLSV